MINLDQVRTLEWKVKQAVQLIVHLRRENDTLRGRLSDTEVRLQELETLLESFKATQNEMESGIRSALEELDHLEAGEAPAPAAGPVDSLSYPPESAPQEFAAQDPGEIFEKDLAPEPAAGPTFEEEYAALAAAEAQAQMDATMEAEVEPVVEPAPESVELEGSVPAEVEDDSLFYEAQVESEPDPVVPEEKEPEQPGLGIF